MKIPEDERRRIVDWAELVSKKTQDRVRGRDSAEKAKNMAFGRMAEIVATRTLEGQGWTVEDVSGEGHSADRGTDLIARKAGVVARIQVKSTPGRMLILPERDYGRDIEYRWTNGDEPPGAFMLVRIPADESGEFTVLGGISAEGMKKRGVLLPAGTPICPGALSEFRIRALESAIGSELGFSPPCRRSEYPDAPRLLGAAWACDADDLSPDPEDYLFPENSSLRSRHDSV